MATSPMTCFLPITSDVCFSLWCMKGTTPGYFEDYIDSDFCRFLKLSIRECKVWLDLYISLQPLCLYQSVSLHPRKLTWNPKMKVWKMFLLFKWVIFRFHVRFPGCIVWPPRMPIIFSPATKHSEAPVETWWFWTGIFGYLDLPFFCEENGGPVYTKVLKAEKLK